MTDSIRPTNELIELANIGDSLRECDQAKRDGQRLSTCSVAEVQVASHGQASAERSAGVGACKVVCPPSPTVRANPSLHRTRLRRAGELQR